MNILLLNPEAAKEKLGDKNEDNSDTQNRNISKSHVSKIYF